MNKADGQDTADRLSAIVANSLDTPAKTQDLARQAYQMGHTGMSVTDVALDANYGSLEAFTRAFRRAFRTSPSIYRRMRDPHFHLPASNKIHFRSEEHTSEL